MKVSELQSLWLVGCGAMGGALLARWRDVGLPDASITIIDPAPKSLPLDFGGRIVAESTDTPPRVIVLGIKPQLLPVVAPGLSSSLEGKPLIVSMLAGVRLRTLSGMFPGCPLARIMPNTPVRVGQGVTGIHAPDLVADDHALVEALVTSTGMAIWLEDETSFDALTAVSGSGPAYLFRFIEALADAAESAGLDRAVAAGLALNTVAGASALAATSGQAPAALRQAVTSPNGVTQAGLEVLDGAGSLSALLRDTVQAAAERSRAMAADAEASVASVGAA